MLLRSSSTPVLGSLISSIAADSPNNHHYETTTSPFRQHYPSTSFHGHNHHHSSLYFHPSPGSLHLSTVVSCGSSPASPSVHDFELKGFRRAQSDGNLEGLAHAACDGSAEEFYNQQHQSMKLSARNKRLMLETIPSFSVYHSRATCEEEEYESDFDEEEEEEEEEENSKVMANSGSTSSHRFNSINTENMLLINNERGLVGVSQEMFLSKGLETAIDGNGIGGRGWGGGGGGEFNSTGSNGAGDGGGGDNHDVEEYYKKMVEGNPGNPLFLGNYAQFLYQSKGDLKGAEEYYSRAILADPKDGETLSQYAKLVWELHRDEERASSYFERAVQASPQDSHVHAAYASFLWETEDDGDECSAPADIDSTIASQFHHGTMASA